MPYTPRHRLSRRRQHTRSLQHDEHHWSVYVPAPHDPVVLVGFGDAVVLAGELAEFGVDREAVVLLDARRRVCAILLDPPPEVGLLVGLLDLPGLDSQFCQTLCIAFASHVEVGPLTDDDRRGYLALRRAHMAQGLLLIDVLECDGDTVRSLAIGCDPDPVWFDEFDPLEDD